MSCYRRFLTLAGCLVATAFAAHAFAESPNEDLSLTGFDGEPTLAVNPANAKNMIAGWMRLRIDGRVAIATRATTDGGATWSAIAFMPHQDSAYGSADVNVVFHRSGIAYLSYVDYRLAPDTVGGVYVARSSDGGLTWGHPVRVMSSHDRPDLPIDRPWIAIDNSQTTSDGALYLTSMSAYWGATPGHHVYLRRSIDGGESWSALRQVDSLPLSVGSLPVSYGAPAVGADGRLYIAHWSYDTTVSRFLRVACASSTDGGATFRRATVSLAFVAPAYKFFYTYAIAAFPDRAGAAAIAWSDGRNGDIDIMLARTSDGGATWSGPVRVNDDPVGNGIVQDRMWLSAGPGGALAAAWRDRRNGGAGSDTPADIFAAISHDAGATFGPNVRVSDTVAPNAALSCCNSFLGVGLVGDNVTVDWSDDRSGDWNVYVARIGAASNVVNSRNALPVPAIEYYPSPAEGALSVRYRVQQSGPVTVELIDPAGHSTELLNERLDAGWHALSTGHSRTLAAGCYQLVVRTPGTRAATSVVVVK